MVFLFLLPLFLSLSLIIPVFLNLSALAEMLQHPQFWGAFGLSLFTGISSTVISLLLAILISRSGSQKMARDAGLFLAMPHVAFAIGFAFLLLPTGIVARIIATFFTTWTSPPQWNLVQDPWGLSLIAALVLKETPFLIWAMFSILQRADVKLSLAQQSRAARSLGHGPRAVWFKIVMPQVLPRMVWPLVAVLAYGLTVVDMALVIGPTQPPTLGLVVWRDLNDGDVMMNARGAAGVILLSTAIAGLVLLSYGILKLLRIPMKKFMTAASRKEHSRFSLPFTGWSVFRLIYASVLLLLVLQSISGHWPFPNLLAEQFTIKAWHRLVVDFAPLFTTIGHAIISAVLAVVLCVAWFESQVPQRDRIILWACGLVLCLPALLLGLAQYRLFLQLGLTGSHSGLFLAHLLPTTAYVFVMLQGPYRGFDPRWKIAAQGLRSSPLTFLLHVKWPMLKSSLWSAAAVGFAVATAQFVGVQLAASGRHATLAMEAVTLTSGGNRALIAVYALALMGLPALAFALAAFFGRGRWEIKSA